MKMLLKHNVLSVLSDEIKKLDYYIKQYILFNEESNIQYLKWYIYEV